MILLNTRRKRTDNASIETVFSAEIIVFFFVSSCSRHNHLCFVATEWAFNPIGNSFVHIPKVSHILSAATATQSAFKHGNYVNDIMDYHNNIPTQCWHRINCWSFYVKMRYYLTIQMIQTAGKGNEQCLDCYLATSIINTSFFLLDTHALMSSYKWKKNKKTGDDKILSSHLFDLQSSSRIYVSIQRLNHTVVFLLLKFDFKLIK